MSIIQLTKRQEEISRIVQENQPITGEKIADLLHVTRAALRSDLVVLTMLGLLDAKPKVGYFYIGLENQRNEYYHFKDMRVSDIMGIPLTSHQGESVYEVIVKIFMEDAGCAFILDDDGFLCGVVSRKDLLKASIGGGDLSKIPIGMIMTRVPNIATVLESDVVFEATEKLVQRQVDSLPVIRLAENGKARVVGKFSKTIITKLFLELKE
ncbi:helix-turn-helix transcriptional regulator [Streptococcus pseudoporcinus]|uniref:Transcriptional repressor CcpN n=1 Tax=Streptococcus pseudoporcinus LQ 940-04 TaxID=875093 RepID=G5K7X2_9STRE|nr:helix-turn-helix transcriptional regulator [Streptococcus pseudoporcinus]EFR45043.1 CBS domain protein [Streptococcus pseudoporcinus SPIN 20026]EHI64183.1 transcriptional repressor CcpN [Streptococcus pseudoporcinus LQ 940-04]